jgi:hypothetical protein
MRALNLDIAGEFLLMAATLTHIKSRELLPPSNEPEPESEEPYRPVRTGDILEHAQFGRCVVQRVDSDQETVSVRLRNGRLVRLNLEVLRLRFQGEEDGHQIFATVGAAGNG